MAPVYTEKLDEPMKKARKGWIAGHMEWTGESCVPVHVSPLTDSVCLPAQLSGIFIMVSDVLGKRFLALNK